jgi:exosortase
LLGLGVLIFALLAYFYFLAIQPYGYPRPLSLVLAIFGIVLYLGGPGVIRGAWLPIFFLALAVPIPDSIYVKLTMPLRLLTTRASAILLSAIPGLELEVQGVLIDYAFRNTTGSLNVEEACSGMRLMMAFVTLGIATAYLGDRPAWQRLLMAAACIPIAVLCNVIRVTLTGVLTVFQMGDFAQGTPHELLGLAMLPIALAMFAATSWVLKHLFVEEPERAAGTG